MWGFSASAWRHEPAASVTGKQLVAVLQQLGFENLRVKGSHHFLRHPDGQTTVVPIHAGETVGPGLLNSILRQVKLSRDDLQRFL